MTAQEWTCELAFIFGLQASMRFCSAYQYLDRRGSKRPLPTNLSPLLRNKEMKCLNFCLHLLLHLSHSIICLKYRLSHSKPGKLILSWWGYRLIFLLIFRAVRVHEKSTFIPSSSVFIKLMLHTIYGPLCKYIFFLSEFWTILNFRGLFQAVLSIKPENVYIFIFIWSSQSKTHEKPSKLLKKI